MTEHSAESARIWKTYRRADGELAHGMYAFFTEPDGFEDDDDGGDYFEVIEEVWSLVSTRTMKFGSTSRWCSVCDEDVNLAEPTPPPILCESCQCSSTQGAADPKHFDGEVRGG